MRLSSEEVFIFLLASSEKTAFLVLNLVPGLLDDKIMYLQVARRSDPGMQEGIVCTSAGWASELGC